MNDTFSQKAKFDFTQAITQSFVTDGGRPFGVRLWFWFAAGLSIVNLIAFPILAQHYPEFLDLNWQNMQGMDSGEVVSEENSLAILSLFADMIPVYLFMMLGVWGFWAVTETALHRRNFFGAEYPRIPIRLGASELRLMLVQLGVFALLFLMYVVLVFAFVLVAGLVGVVTPPAFTVLIVVVGLFAVIAILVHMMVRLAPAGALSVETNERRILSALPVAKGRFWSLFMAYLFVSIGGYVASYIVIFITSLLFSGNGDIFMAIMGGGAEQPSVVLAQIGEKLKNPIYMLFAVLAIIAHSGVIALMYLSISGVGSYALKLFREDNPA